MTKVAMIDHGTETAQIGYEVICATELPLTTMGHTGWTLRSHLIIPRFLNGATDVVRLLSLAVLLLHFEP
jgi:hypothetical protein